MTDQELADELLSIVATARGGPIGRQPAAISETVADVIAVLARLRWSQAPDKEPIGTTLEYERFVEAPRRNGIDPVWEAMLAEALGPPTATAAA